MSGTNATVFCALEFIGALPAYIYPSDQMACIRSSDGCMDGWMNTCQIWIHLMIYKINFEDLFEIDPILVCTFDYLPKDTKDGLVLGSAKSCSIILLLHPPGHRNSNRRYFGLSPHHMVIVWLIYHGLDSDW